MLTMLSKIFIALLKAIEDNHKMNHLVCLGNYRRTFFFNLNVADIKKKSQISSVQQKQRHIGDYLPGQEIVYFQHSKALFSLLITNPCSSQRKWLSWFLKPWVNVIYIQHVFFYALQNLLKVMLVGFINVQVHSYNSFSFIIV